MSDEHEQVSAPESAGAYLAEQMQAELEEVIAANEAAIANAQAILDQGEAFRRNHGIRPDTGRQILRAMGDEVVVAADAYLAEDMAEAMASPDPGGLDGPKVRNAKPRMMV